MDSYALKWGVCTLWTLSLLLTSSCKLGFVERYQATNLSNDAAGILLLGATSIEASTCAGPYVIQGITKSGVVPATLDPATRFSIGGVASSELYLDSSCNYLASGGEVPVNTSDTTTQFFLKIVQSNPITLTANASGLDGASISLLVSLGAPSQIKVIAPGSIGQYQCVEVRGQLQDTDNTVTTARSDILVKPLAFGQNGVYLYPNGACQTPVADILVSAGQTGFSIYVLAPTSGTVSVTFSGPSGIANGSTTLSVLPGSSPRLAIAPPGGNLVAGTCVALTIRSLTSDGSPLTVRSDMPVALTSSASNGQFFADNACAAPLSNSTVTLSAFTTSTTVYFKGILVATNFTFTASTSGFISGTSTHSIIAAAPHLILMGNAFTSIRAGECRGPVSLTLKDEFRNNAIATAATTLILFESGSSGPATQFFRGNDSLCGAAVSEVIVENGNSATAFYFLVKNPGTSTLNASSGTLTAATSTVTVANAEGRPDTIAFVSQNSNPVAGECVPTTLISRDGFGNSKDVQPQALSFVLNTTVAGSGFFSDVACSTNLTQTTLVRGATQSQLYFRVTAKAITSASATETVGANPLAAQVTFNVNNASPSQLQFVGAPALIYRNECFASPIDLMVKDAFGNTSPVANNTFVILSASNGGRFYNDSLCTSMLSSVTIGAGMSQRSTLFFKGPTVGTMNLVASTTGLNSATSTVNVETPPATMLSLNFPASVKAGACQALNISSVNSSTNQLELYDPLSISLSSNSTNPSLFFSDSGCQTPLTSTVAMNSPSDNPYTAYFKNTRSESIQISASAGAMRATVNTTVNPAPATKIVFDVAGTASIIKEICTGPYKIYSQDTFGNSSPVLANASLSFSVSGNPIDVYSDKTCSTSTVAILGTTSQASFYIRSVGTGNGTVTASTSGLSSGTHTWDVLNPSAEITLIVPNQGSPSGGDTIRIDGNTFLAGVAVTIAGQNCSNVTLQSSSRLTCVTLAGSVGFATLVVANPSALRTIFPNGFQYVNAPVVAFVSPASGPTAGGTEVTITGSNFDSAASVMVGSQSCTSLSITNNQIKCSTPAGAAGLVTISVTNPNGLTGSLANAFRYFGPPMLANISPTSGLETGGTTLLINGSSFESIATIDVGGAPCVSPVITPTLLTCTTTAHAPGAADVRVTNPDGQMGTMSDAFTYLGLPTISQLLPNTRPTTGETAIGIEGTNFDAQTSVQVGGASCTNIRNLSATFLTCDTQAAANIGAVNVSVTNRSLQTATKTNGFTYTYPNPSITRITPSSGGSQGGTAIEIDGNYFRSGATIEVGGVACNNVVYQSLNRMTCVTAAHAPGIVAILLANPIFGAITYANGFTYVSEPLITSVQPASGSTAGGTDLVIRGSEFYANIQIKLDSSACTAVNLISPMEVRCKTSAHAAGPLPVTATNADGGVATLANGFTYIAPPEIYSVSPNHGPSQGGIALTLNGANLTTGIIISVGGQACTPVMLLNPTQATCSMPAITPGNATIVVTNTDGQSATLATGFTADFLPNIVSITPTSLPATGGATLVITGDKFLGASVSVGGSTCVLLPNATTSELRCTTPAISGATTTIVVKNSDGQTVTFSNSFTVNPIPTVASIIPAHGPASGGTNITISGTNFGSGASVRFGNLFATNVSVSPNQISGKSPAGMPAGNTNVTVVNPDNQIGTLANGYLVDAPPMLTSVTPNHGPASGGTTITFAGSEFVKGPKVFFGSTECSPVTFGSSTSLSCFLPAMAAGVLDVRVQNPDGQSYSLSNSFTIDPPPALTSISPTNGPASQSFTLTLTGNQFVNGAPVKIRDTACSPVTFLSQTSLSCQTPVLTAGTADVSVTNPDGQTATLSGALTLDTAPSIASVTPSNGTSTGGTSIQISGTNFLVGATVDLGGSACMNVNVGSPSQITCLTSSHAPAVVIVLVRNPDGQVGTLSNGFTYNPPPLLTSVSPQNGPGTGGTSLSLTGDKFAQGTSILIGGLSCGNIQIISKTQATCDTPAHVPGTVEVKIINPDTQSLALAQGFTYDPAPNINTVTPNHGPAAGGANLVLFGANYVNGSIIKLDGTFCPTTFVNATTLSCVTPSHPAGAVDIAVVNPDAQSFMRTAGFTYDPSPTIVSINPASGIGSGGNSITITGTGFVAGITADFGGSACGSVIVDSAIQIRCTTTNHVAGSVEVKVTNADGQSAIKTSGYTYLPPPTIASVTPSYGPAAGETFLKISGQDFIGGLQVKLGGTLCWLVNVDPSSINCTSQSHAPGTFKVTIINPDGQLATLPNGYTFNAGPTITSVDPNHGSSAGGQIILINGSNFVSGTRVTMQASTCTSPTTIGTTQLSCVTPAHVPGSVDVTVTNPDGQSSTKTNGYLFNAPPILLSVVPSSGPNSGGTQLTIRGIGFVNGAVVRVGTQVCLSSTVQSDVQIVCNTPSYSGVGPRLIGLSVSNPDNQTEAFPDAFTYRAPPMVTAITPDNGKQSGGETLAISGANFSLAPNVKIGTVPCHNTVRVSDSQITCSVPIRSQCGSYPVVVTNSDGQKNSNHPNYTYNCAPTFANISPTHGPATINTSITVSGFNFNPGVTVTMGGANCTSVNRISSKRLTCTTPLTNLYGTAEIEIKNTDGQFARSSNAFVFDPPPAIASIAPTTIPVTVASSITINGSNFAAGATAFAVRPNFFGPPYYTCQSTIVDAPTQVRCQFAGAPAGTYRVQVQNPDGQNGKTSDIALTIVAAPTVTTVSPPNGPKTGGTLVSLTGTGFVSGATIKIGNSACTNATVSKTSAMCTTSTSQSGTFDVTLTNPNLQVGIKANGFTYDGPPSITSFTPLNGPASGGTKLMVTGSGFQSVSTVKFDGSACTVNPTTQTASSFECLTTSHAAGTASLVVTNPDGQSSLASTETFNFLAPPSVSRVASNHGPATGTTDISIQGANFQSGITATLDKTMCVNPQFVNGREFRCTTQAHFTGPVDVIVTNPDGQSFTYPNGFTYDGAPIITEVSPAHGHIMGGTSITILGNGFINPVSVDIGGTVCGNALVLNNGTTVTCTTTAAHAEGPAYVRVSNVDGQSGQLSNAFTFDPPPTISGIIPTSGPQTIATTLAVSGTGFLPALTAVFTNYPCNIVLGSVTPTTFSCYYAAGFPYTGPANFTVTNPDGQTNTKAGAYTFVAPPSLSYLNPTEGASSGGTLITIYGIRFSATSSVFINNTPCTGVVAYGNSQLQCVTGSHFSGTFNVTVRNADAQQSIKLNGFTYNPPPKLVSITPTSGPSELAAIEIIDPLERKIASSTVALTVMAPPPSISGISIITGPAGGGTLIQVSGQNFRLVPTVSFGGSNCVVAGNVNPAAFSCTTTQHTAGIVSVTVTNPDGQGATLPNVFSYQLPSVPVINSVIPPTGAMNGEIFVAIQGDGYVTGMTAIVGESPCSNVIVNSLFKMTCVTAISRPGY